MSVSVFDYFCECGKFSSPCGEDAVAHVRLNHHPHERLGLADLIRTKIYSIGHSVDELTRNADDQSAAADTQRQMVAERLN